MQKIRETALASYDKFPDEQKYKAYAIFEALDSNGDGTVSLDEYEEFFGSSGSFSFRQLDANGDGKLDFEEFITLFYLILSSKGANIRSLPPLLIPQVQLPNLPNSSPESNQGFATRSGSSKTRRNRIATVLQAIQDFNTGWQFGEAMSKIADACTMM